MKKCMYQWSCHGTVHKSHRAAHTSVQGLWFSARSAQQEKHDKMQMHKATFILFSTDSSAATVCFTKLKHYSFSFLNCIEKSIKLIKS